MIPLLTLFLAASFDLKTGVDYLVVDVRTREVLQQQWTDAGAPIPVGSLVKPFTALAYSGNFPEFICRGAADRCWLAHGHGRLVFRDALAQSCNAYFLNLAREVDPATLAVVASKFGIPAPAADTAEARIGLGKEWRISPLALARAYAELAARASESRVADILAGMRTAARNGTASALGRDSIVLAKTGTAPCVAERNHRGDGFTIVLDPADAPRTVLLVRVHGVPGAEAAKSAGHLMRALRGTQ
ncbi:MAG TPA: penicillin-binding transpeptidase domain-containing protein [Bryobacteraceae bacterium]|nr:penicillin-binding transpeptidase domain-containing protein [Bryobacteraceae bacterium]